LAKKAAVTYFALVNYKKSVAKFLAYLGDRADLRKAVIIGFRDKALQSVSATTVNLDLRVLCALFRSAKAEGYIVKDPAEFVQNARRETGRPGRTGFTLEQLRMVLCAANDEWRSMILFGFYTGQRLSDFAALTWSNIDLERDIIRLTTRKAGKPLVIPMGSPLRSHVVSLPSSDNPAAPLHPRAFRIVSSKTRNASQLSSEFVDLLAALGIRAPILHNNSGKGCGGRKTTSQFSFHSLRHTAVSLLKEAGVPQAAVQELVGHESVQMSQQYTHVGLEALQKAAAALPDL
jgi:integrase